MQVELSKFNDQISIMKFDSDPQEDLVMEELQHNGKIYAPRNLLKCPTVPLPRFNNLELFLRQFEATFQNSFTQRTKSLVKLHF